MPSPFIQAHCLLSLKVIASVLRPVWACGLQRCVTPMQSLSLLGPRERSQRAPAWSFPSPALGAGKWVFFLPAACTAHFYNVSALENDRKKWHPAGPGRSRPLPAPQRRDFCSNSSYSCLLGALGQGVEGLGAGSGFCPLPVQGLASFRTHHLKI